MLFTPIFAAIGLAGIVAITKVTIVKAITYINNCPFTFAEINDQQTFYVAWGLVTTIPKVEDGTDLCAQAPPINGSPAYYPTLDLFNELGGTSAVNKDRLVFNLIDCGLVGPIFMNGPRTSNSFCLRANRVWPTPVWSDCTDTTYDFVNYYQGYLCGLYNVEISTSTSTFISVTVSTIPTVTFTISATSTTTITLFIPTTTTSTSLIVSSTSTTTSTTTTSSSKSTSITRTTTSTTSTIVSVSVVPTTETSTVELFTETTTTLTLSSVSRTTTTDTLFTCPASLSSSVLSTSTI